MTPNVAHFLGIKEKNRQKRIMKTKTKDAKKVRKEKVFEKLRNDEQVKRNERKKKFGVYRSGINMEDPEEFGWYKSPKKKKSKQSTEIACKHCGLAGHSRTSSWQCLKHKAKPEPTATAVQEHTKDADDSDADAAVNLDAFEGETLQQHLDRFDDGDDPQNLNDDDRDDEVQQLHVL
jgi:hypothetical protein